MKSTRYHIEVWKKTPSSYTGGIWIPTGKEACNISIARRVCACQRKLSPEDAFRIMKVTLETIDS